MRRLSGILTTVATVTAMSVDWLQASRRLGAIPSGSRTAMPTPSPSSKPRLV